MSAARNRRIARALRNTHTLCLARSGPSLLCDIPLSVSMSFLPFADDPNEPLGRIATRRLRIRPDAGRLLNTECVSDDLYRQIAADKSALSEGAGAERLFAVIRSQDGQPESTAQGPRVRYSMNGRRDLRLIRNYLRREGFHLSPPESMPEAMKIIDVRHALMILAGVGRTIGTGLAIPKELQDYDLDSKAFSATELCGLCGVAVPEADFRRRGTLVVGLCRP